MKNIEDINRESVKKILAKKKYQIFLQGILLKLEREFLKGREKESNTLKAFALLRKIEI